MCNGVGALSTLKARRLKVVATKPEKNASQMSQRQGLTLLCKAALDELNGLSIKPAASAASAASRTLRGSKKRTPDDAEKRVRFRIQRPSEAVAPLTSEQCAAIVDNVFKGLDDSFFFLRQAASKGEGKQPAADKPSASHFVSERNTGRGNGESDPQIKYSKTLSAHCKPAATADLFSDAAGGCTLRI